MNGALMIRIQRCKSSVEADLRYPCETWGRMSSSLVVN